MAEEPNEPLSEEEFLELVLDEQQKALDAEREQRLLRAQGIHTPRKKKKWVIRLIAYFVACALVFNVAALFFQIYSIPAIEFLQTSARLSQSETIQQYQEAVVEIRTTDSKGTGFSISDDGWLITNEHVIDDALSITVSFPDAGVYEAEVIASDPAIDTAFLKIDAHNVPSLQFATNPTYEINEDITFIGNPLAFSGIANEGTLAGAIQLSDWPIEVQQIDAPVYKGNSGSPVFNTNGDVIGVVFATLNNESLGKVGLFIPIHDILERAPEELQTLLFTK